MPKRRANHVFVLPEPVTVSWLGFTAATHPVAMIAVAVHEVVYVKVKERFGGVLDAAYAVAVDTAVEAFGRSCAPARAAASVALCSWRLP